MRDLFVTAVGALLLTPILLISTLVGYAQVMGSGNYRIQSDSINFGGGLSTSTNYSLESTGGEVGTGESSSASYGLGAGYQQMLNSYLALSAVNAVSLSPSIPGLSGGFSNGSTTFTVTTDNMAGYILTVSAENSPAMQKGGDSILDYVPEGNDPDYTFLTGAADAHLGYSPEGVDIVSRFKDNGSFCNTGSGDTVLACWDGLDVGGETIARRASGNHPEGSTTTLNFRVGVGGSVIQPPGNYIATTTLTLLAL